MIMKKSVRSGEYALCVRYRSVGVGVDTDKWIVAVDNRDATHSAPPVYLECLA